ncbi:MAG: membrane protein insertase YidC [Zetaproteobacteria bacterium CG12_big_fil_rev_8_21_14_0_65_54_13]|nr:MAG: membrane protein insertase YidC [Zetaproteobacteria bacterium CG23_combo_of_CG06-09_8_20_14_all_54_7]PIW51478.1 MAG: membrane protein insertase YidC [Zetaproteobacteria bacterium CG12_big_fil_rev_8_21_14_0_65_54_13]PIX55847.1 MAG: membrane protein insertase YidC [Zetaproteobacteria bacterium CG_4_10_14_3_um_filter_54_28]PJA27962.1 MAG: membrane protein insertase YidC [Zetaproteobacteria bacterium CG_4_9_14_3_um_filter_54_145]
MDQRNLILAFALSMAVLLGWSALFPQQEQAQPQLVQEAGNPPVNSPEPPLSDAAPSSSQFPLQDMAPPSLTVAGEHFTIANDLLDLTMDGRGWFTEAKLKQYRVAIEPGAANVSVLSMADDGPSVYVNSGVMGRTIQKPFTVINKSDNAMLLQATLDNGLVWQRQIALAQGSYVIEIEDRVLDGAGQKIYRQVVERHPDKNLNTFYEHMGPTALLAGKLQEPDYDDLDTASVRMSADGGWTAIMNRYFITALISNADQNYPYYFKGDGRSYQAGLIDDGKIDGRDSLFHSRMYLGPKSLTILKEAGDGLDRSIDYGWFAFISKPMHTFLLWLYSYVGNFGWCIVLLVLSIKILFFWPTQKSYQSMASMRKLQPEMARMKELYGDDRQKMSQEMMALYKKHKVNPMGGCLPIIIQIPVFFALYKVLLMSIEMRQAPFIGWIHDMSVQDPYFVLPVIMGISMFVQQRLNPQPADPMQAKIMQFLPPVFTILFLFFPAGLVLYWVVNNVLSIAQQKLVMKRMNVE